MSSSEQRSQLRNRETALAKLAGLVAAGLAPDAAKRRATKPTRGSVRRRLSAKGRRSETKKQRQRPVHPSSARVWMEPPGRYSPRRRRKMSKTTFSAKGPMATPIRV